MNNKNYKKIRKPKYKIGDTVYYFSWKEHRLLKIKIDEIRIEKDNIKYNFLYLEKHLFKTYKEAIEYEITELLMIFAKKYKKEHKKEIKSLKHRIFKNIPCLNLIE